MWDSYVYILSEKEKQVIQGLRITCIFYFLLKCCSLYENHILMIFSCSRFEGVLDLKVKCRLSSLFEQHKAMLFSIWRSHVDVVLDLKVTCRCFLDLKDTKLDVLDLKVTSIFFSIWRTQSDFDLDLKVTCRCWRLSLIQNVKQLWKRRMYKICFGFFLRDLD